MPASIYRILRPVRLITSLWHFWEHRDCQFTAHLAAEHFLSASSWTAGHRWGYARELSLLATPDPLQLHLAYIIEDIMSSSQTPDCLLSLLSLGISLTRSIPVSLPFFYFSFILVHINPLSLFLPFSFSFFSPASVRKLTSRDTKTEQEQGARPAMADPGTRAAMANPGTRAVMAEQWAWAAMAGPPPIPRPQPPPRPLRQDPYYPPKIFLG